MGIPPEEFSLGSQLMSNTRTQTIKITDGLIDNIDELTDRQVQEMLKRIDPLTLSMAMLDMRDSVKHKILNNMSKRAAQMVTDEISQLDMLDARSLMIKYAQGILLGGLT